MSGAAVVATGVVGAPGSVAGHDRRVRSGVRLLRLEEVAAGDEGDGDAGENEGGKVTMESAHARREYKNQFGCWE